MLHLFYNQGSCSSPDCTKGENFKMTHSIRNLFTFSILSVISSRNFFFYLKNIEKSNIFANISEPFRNTILKIWNDKLLWSTPINPRKFPRMLLANVQINEELNEIGLNPEELGNVREMFEYVKETRVCFVSIFKIIDSVEYPGICSER